MADPPGRPLSSPTPSQMAMLVIEAVDRVASPDARESVMHLALADGGLTVVPEDLASFRAFVLGPLKRAMELALGRELSHAVLSDLSPIIERAATTMTSGIRARARGARDLLVLVTIDPTRAEVLDGSTDVNVRVVPDLFELLRVVEGLGEARTAIVVDCDVPSARPAGLATLARVLPPSVEVVLWGVDRIGPDELDLDALPEAWAKLDASAGPGELLARAFPEASMRTTEPPPAAVEELAPLRVALVVHEDATSRAALAAALARAGYEVVTAPDSYLAVELARSREPSVVIADEALARVDGAKLLRLLRRVARGEAPRTVLLATEPLPFRDPAIDLVIDEGQGADAVVAAIDLGRGRSG